MINGLTIDLEPWWVSEFLGKYRPEENDDQIEEAVRPILNLLNTHELESRIDEYDAVAFFDYFIKIRDFKDVNLDETPIEEMWPATAASKIYMYDTETGKCLYYKLISKGYSTFTKKRLPEAALKIAQLKGIPTIHEVLAAENKSNN